MVLGLAREPDKRMSRVPSLAAIVEQGELGIGQAMSRQGQTTPVALLAAQRAGESIRLATLYTNAEPCIDASEPLDGVARLIELRPARIVIGASLGFRAKFGSETSSRIVKSLERAGIVVDIGVLEDECREVNHAYYKYAETGLPFVTIKFAATMDGRIATVTGDSQWISGEQSLKLAHELRRDHDAVLVGVGTVLSDDPKLTVRRVEGPNPLRVVVDSQLRIPCTANLLRDGLASGTLIATSDQADPSRIEELTAIGAQIVTIPRAKPHTARRSDRDCNHERSQPESLRSNRLDLSALLSVLAERGIDSVLVEGGSEIITSLLAGRVVDRLVAAIAPKILGSGLPAIGDLGIQRLSDAITFRSMKTHKLGNDIIFDGRF